MKILHLTTLVLVFLFISMSTKAEIQVEGPYSYTITKGANDSEPTIQAPWGTWTGYIALTRTAHHTKYHELVFEFYSDDYFGSDNNGHWAVAVRADGESDVTGDGHPNLRGSGIIIGNVTGYSNSDPACSPTSYHSTTAIEEFWATGNCVFGSGTEGPALQNGERYRIQITSQFFPGELDMEDHLITSYTVWEFDNGSWTHLDTTSKLMPADFNPSPENLAGMFMTEVFSDHAWEVQIDNMTLYMCDDSEGPCSGL